MTQKQKEYVIDSVSEASSDKKEVFLNSVSQIYLTI